MTTDPQTLGVYDERAREYAGMLKREAPDPDLERFIAQLGAVGTGGHVLDLGCGPGAASALLRAKGFSVDPVDASRGMVDLANEMHGIGARLASFDDLDAVAAYEGVWANFSLLHAPRKSLPGHLAAIFTALKPGGVFHIGMKTGSGDHRDRLGRMYSYHTSAQLRALLDAAGFERIAETEGEGKGLAGDISPWITILCRRPA